MKRTQWTVCAVIAAAQTLFPLAAAWGQEQPGSLAKTGVYRGKATTPRGQNSPNFVTLAVSGERITELAFKFRMQCSDGTARTLRGDLSPSTRPVNRTDGNRFGFTDSESGNTVSIDGVFSGSADRPTVTGKVSIVGVRGAVTCTTNGPGRSTAASYTNQWDGATPNVDN